MSTLDDAHDLAGAVRRLTHATVDPDTTPVADVYAIVGDLTETVVGLHQTTGQLARVLGRRLAGDRLHQDRGHPHTTPAEAVAAALDALAEVAGLLEQAAHRFDTAQQAIAGTAERTPDPPPHDLDGH